MKFQFTNDGHRRTPVGISTALICLVVCALAPLIQACDFCIKPPKVPFAFDQLQAIEVALATQDAATRQTIDLNPSITLAGGTTEVPLAVVTPEQLVREWMMDRPARQHRSLRCVIEIDFIDVDASCRFDIRHGEVLRGDSSQGPAEVRIMTTKAGFVQMLKLGLTDCEKNHLVAIEAQTSHRDEMKKLFADRRAPAMTLVAGDGR